MIWHPKQRPQDFFGPEDYDGRDIAEIEQEIKAAQQAWDRVQRRLSWGQMIRWLCSDGIWVEP